MARSIQRGADCDAVYGYIDASLLSFRAAKARGLRCFYEVPTIYWRTKQRLLREDGPRPATEQGGEVQGALGGAGGPGDGCAGRLDCGNRGACRHDRRYRASRASTR